MSNIKKAYAELYSILVENKNKKVSTVLPQLVELMSAKQSQKNFITNDKGEVTHVFCYYHKQWEDVTVAEYGAKKHSASGLNTMCKEGVSAWTKQQRIKKEAKAKLLEDLAGGNIEQSEVSSKLKDIEESAKAIVTRADGHYVDADEL